MVARVAVGGMVAGLAVAVSLMPRPLHVELFSLTLFLGGVVLGGRGGAMAGAAGAAAMSLSSPYGLPSLPLLAAQMLGGATWGLAGGLAGTLASVLPTWTWGLAGGAFTLWYQLLVNLSLVVGTGNAWAPVLAAGLAPALVQVASNTVLFAVLGPTLAHRVAPIRARLASAAGPRLLPAGT